MKSMKYEDMDSDTNIPTTFLSKFFFLSHFKSSFKSMGMK